MWFLLTIINKFTIVIIMARSISRKSTTAYKEKNRENKKDQRSFYVLCLCMEERVKERGNIFFHMRVPKSRTWKENEVYTLIHVWTKESGTVYDFSSRPKDKGIKCWVLSLFFFIIILRIKNPVIKLTIDAFENSSCCMGIKTNIFFLIKKTNILFPAGITPTHSLSIYFIKLHSFLPL